MEHKTNALRMLDQKKIPHEVIDCGITEAVSGTEMAGIIGETGDGNYITNTPQGSAIIDTMTDMLCHFAGSLLCFIATISAFVKKSSNCLN